MARILVAGGLFSDDQDPDMGAARTAFAEAIGRETVRRGNVLLGGCRTALDATVANAGRAQHENAKRTRENASNLG